MSRIDYSKWDKMNVELDYKERIAKKLPLQPPFVHPIEWYLNKDNCPCPNTVYAHFYQMNDAGWDAECIDFKLAQIVHYSRDAVRYRELMQKQNMQKLMECQQETLDMTKLTEKKFEELKQNNNFFNVEEDAIQQSKTLEKNLFEERVQISSSHKKRELEELPTQQEMEP